MQSGAANAIRESLDSNSSKLLRKSSSSTDQQQGTYSLELWKKAFRDACESICPVRAGGHECGCLPLLPKLVNFFEFCHFYLNDEFLMKSSVLLLFT